MKIYSLCFVKISSLFDVNQQKKKTVLIKRLLTKKISFIGALLSNENLDYDSSLKEI
jgi:hypothetical protein